MRRTVHDSSSRKDTQEKARTFFSKMSKRAESDATAIKHEYEKLSNEASSLARTLARRRADIALMRAEAATVAVSLESAKDQLDTALRKESVIRSDAHKSSNDEANPVFVPDDGLIRALAGQLEVTREYVQTAKEKRASLREEIHHLEDGTREQSTKEHPVFETLSEKSSEVSASGVESRRKPLPHEGNTADVLAKMSLTSRPGSSAEENAFHALKESTESQSSFRLDHARVWRDVNMPNLTVVRTESPEPTLADTSLGVVSERIFEGVACFTSTEATKDKDRAPNELRIRGCGEIARPSQALSEVVGQHYRSLSATTKENDTEVRLVAPKAALERVANLVANQGSDVTKRWQSTRDVNEETPPSLNKPSSRKLTEKIREVKVSAESEKESAERRSLAHLAERISMRRSNRSDILTDEQFAKIISTGVPARFQESALKLLYSTELHGISLHTLYHKGAKTSPTLVVIRDTRNRIFGCYATQAWKSSATRYYGSGESFVFGSRASSTMPIVYKWSRLNSFFQFTSSTFLAMGGGAGSHFALWIDEDLLMGTTSACSTFESPPLIDIEAESKAATREFKILSMELWGFVTHRKR